LIEWLKQKHLNLGYKINSHGECLVLVESFQINCSV